MEQKVIQIGNSVGVVIPQALQKGVSLRVGEEVMIEKDPISDSFIISKKGVKRSSITPGFLKIIENINKRYGKALQELAQK